MPQYHPLLQGAIELHCHSDPSIFPRKQHDWELVKDIKAAGMAGAVIKSHESSTVDRTALIRAQEPGLEVYGGLVCNYFTGGLSPYAVDAALRLGAKVIWMPTISSQEHLDHFAQKKTRFFSSDEPLRQPAKGLKIWDDEERLLPEVDEILELIAKADVVLATGHLSVKEVVRLVDAALERGVRKLLIQHADLGIAPLSLDVQTNLARKGAIIEKCYLACSSDFQDVSLAQMADSIRHIGHESCALVTDYGQAHNIPLVAALSQFVDQLSKAGIPEAALHHMLVNNPKQLLNLS